MSILLFNSSAFAIDQLVLRNGKIVEGKVLSEVPNRHVDIQLVNGDKKRYKLTDVTSVDRDVPSNIDNQMRGNSSEFYAGAQLGMNLGLNTGGSSNFTWGARFGANVSQIDNFAKIAVGLSFLHLQETVSIYTVSVNQVLAQVLFRKVSNTGFYFGPELGFNLNKLTAVGSTESLSSTAFTFGALAGYDYFVNSNFSFGPDLRFESTAAASLASSTGSTSTLQTESSSSLKIMLTGTYHF